MGEWTAASVKIPNSPVTNPSGTPGSIESYTLHMHGDNSAGSKALIVGYAESRAVPFSPDPNVPPAVSTNWISSIFNEGTVQDNAVLNSMEDDFDEVPYDLTRYPGADTLQPEGELIDTVEFTGTTVSARNRVKPFNAPCGLIKVNNATGQDLTLYIDLVPGHHRGYLCEPMTDM